jgi:hypothetical protein
MPDSRDDANARHDAFSVTDARHDAFTVTDARHDAFTVTDARHDAFTVTDAGVNAGVERQALVRGAPPKVGMRDRRR